MRSILAAFIFAVSSSQAVTGPCDAAEYRAFDFWVGDWTVVGKQRPDRPATNRIQAIDGGCALLEQYRAPGGYSGTSLSFFEASSGRWRQLWIDSQGRPLELVGGPVDGGMVLEDRSREGVIDRVSWTKIEGGRVRQHWQRSQDGGESWTTVFDGTYTRRQED